MHLRTWTLRSCDPSGPLQGSTGSARVREGPQALQGTSFPDLGSTCGSWACWVKRNRESQYGALVSLS